MSALPPPTGPPLSLDKPVSIDTLSHIGPYTARAQAVYWNKSTPACRAHGPGRAECLLLPGHAGPHYGNGYDRWGPNGSRAWPS